MGDRFFYTSRKKVILAYMQNIADILVNNNIVQTRFEDPFTWTSGIRSPIYCDCRELISIPEAREHIVRGFLATIESQNLPCDIIAGTATAGIPWAAFVAQALEKPMLYVRAKPKSHGAGKMVEGRAEHGKHILVVEDALSTAGSSIVSANALRSELEATVTDICAIFSWDTPLAHENGQKARLTLRPLTLFEEIVASLLRNERITSDQKAELERFHASPADWWQG